MNDPIENDHSTTAKKEPFVSDDSKSLPVNLSTTEPEIEFERKAPGGNALWIAAVYMLGVALFALVIYYIL